MKVYIISFQGNRTRTKIKDLTYVRAKDYWPVSRSFRSGGQKLLENWSETHTKIQFEQQVRGQLIEVPLSKLKFPLPDIHVIDQLDFNFLFSQKAVDIFRPLMPEAEFLPIKCEIGYYYLLNLPSNEYPIDLSTSKFYWWYERSLGIQDEVGKVTEHFIQYNFFSEIVKQNLVMFNKYALNCEHFFVREDFIEICKQHNLNVKAEFFQVWDSEDPNTTNEFFNFFWGWDTKDPSKREEFIQEYEKYQEWKRNPPKPPEPAFTYTRVTQPEYQHIYDQTLKALEQINKSQKQKLRPGNDSRTLVMHMTKHINQLRSQKLKGQALVEATNLLGAFWGEQVCRQYDWRWGTTHTLLLISPEIQSMLNPFKLIEKILQGELEATHASSLFNTLALPSFANAIKSFDLA
jgi:hypothetical protein